MLRSDEKAKFTKRVVTSTTMVVILIFYIFAIGAARQDVQRSSKLLAADGEKEIVKRVKQYPDAPISLQNREECPILIQEANVKEITSDEYYQLTRMKTDSNVYVSFPKVKLINKTGKRLTGFALFLNNSRTGRTNFLKRSRTTVEPNGDYSVVFNEWVVPEKLTQVTDNGKTVNIKQRLNLDSEKMWLEGSARDFVLEVVEVTLEDGSKWSTKSPSLGSRSDAQYAGKWYLQRTSYSVTTNSAATNGLVPVKQMRALRIRPFQCVCSCGADCSGGGTTCTGSCACGGFDCIFCMADCCVAAARLEGCLN